VLTRLAALTVTCVVAAGAAAEVVTLSAVRDNTVYEINTSEEQYSNALGPFLYCGKNAGNQARRALIQFDLSSIPAGSVIESVNVRVVFERGGPSSSGRNITLHRVTSAWGEGTSNAGLPGGTGALATPGDASWDFRIFPNQAWTTPGGDFVATPSATIVSGLGLKTWLSTPELVADVQGWVNDPSSNHGWVIIGAEGTPGSAMRMFSREGGAAPEITVTYSPGRPPCGTADFDGDGDVGTDADIEACFACLGGHCCDTCFELGADFDADGDVGTDADIESFFRVLAGGDC
jgi:hypothetical protein